MDFRDANKAPKVINGWTSDQTRGKIKRILEFIDPETAVFLASALHFRGRWKYEFDKKETEKVPFYNLDGSRTDVKMMQLYGGLSQYRAERFTIVDLPYGDSLFSMSLISPRYDISVNDLVDSLDDETLSEAVSKLDIRDVLLKVPRFRLETTHDKSFRKALFSMGVPAMFGEMVEDRHLELDTSVHKTFVEVNESGIEAAVATGIGVPRISVVPGPPTIVFDRPFVFVIRERHSGSLLFIGKVASLESD